MAPTEKKFHYAPVGDRLGITKEELAKHWGHTVPAYRNAPHVWNVGGQDNVAAYLVDTGDGCILIDTGLAEETLYLLIDRIWCTGHDPMEIKKIFLTHWHGDHTVCARELHEMTGCEIWLSETDEAEHQKHANDGYPISYPDPVKPYVVTNFYDDSKPIVMGNMTIRTRMCPGHTAGCTSFFFEDTDEKTGKTYKIAMHGGLGVGKGMRPEALAAQGLDPHMTERFIKDCYELAEIPVDIPLASHLNHENILPNIPADPDDYTVFIADYAWGDLMRNRAQEAQRVLGGE